MLQLSILKTAVIVILIVLLVIGIIKHLLKLFIGALVVILLFTGYFMYKYNMSFTDTITQYKNDINYGIVVGKDLKNILDNANKLSQYAAEGNKENEINECIQETRNSANSIKNTPHSKAYDKYTNSLTGNLDSLVAVESNVSQAYKVKDNSKIQNEVGKINNLISSIK